MEENELLDALDRRAGTAVAALDDRLTDAEPPPLPLPVDADPSRRRWVPLLVAAGLVVVALLGVGLALADRDDEQGTVADDRDAPVEAGGGMTRLALPDPAALGYEVRTAFDGPSMEPLPGMEGIDMRLTAHGSVDDADPWASAVVSSVLPLDDHTFVGELVDVGGPEAVHVPMGPSDRVLWRDGDRALMLMSSRVRDEDLVQVAAAAVASGWTGEGPLPGHQVLHEGTPDSFQPGLEYAGFGPTGWQGVAYDADGTDRDLVIAWRPGSEAALAALHALQEEERSVSVAGQQVQLSEGGGATHAAWLLDDDTLVQAATHGDVAQVLGDVLPRLEPISSDDLRVLVDAHPPSAEAATIDPPAGASDPVGGEGALTSIRLDQAGTGYLLEVGPDRVDRLTTMLSIEDDSGSSGSGGPVRDLDTPALMAGGLTTGPGGEHLTPLVVSGLVPSGVTAGLEGVRIVDRASGAELDVLDHVTGDVPGSTLLLAIVLVDATPGTPIDVIFPTADGDRTWRF